MTHFIAISLFVAYLAGCALILLNAFGAIFFGSTVTFWQIAPTIALAWAMVGTVIESTRGRLLFAYSALSLFLFSQFATIVRRQHPWWTATVEAAEKHVPEALLLTVFFAVLHMERRRIRQPIVGKNGSMGAP